MQTVFCPSPFWFISNLARCLALFAGTMNAIPPDFGLPAATGPSPHGPDAPALDRQWAVLRNAVLAIGSLIPAAELQTMATPLDFPEELHSATGWRKVMIEQGLSDLIAMMEPGLTALLAVHAQGGNASTAAMTLWQEFAAARLALVALAPVVDTDPKVDESNSHKA